MSKKTSTQKRTPGSLHPGRSASCPWQPNEEEEKFVACIGRMALDALAANGVVDRATFVENLHGLARCLERLQ